MRLERLSVFDWRRWRGGPWTVSFSPKATILQGPNERGKSTLFEAIEHVLFSPAKTQGAWLKRVMPYGLEGAEPHVTLDFALGSMRYRIAKWFGRRGRASLSELKDGIYFETHRNDEATEELLRRLGLEAGPGRLSPRSLGPFQWFFVAQDRREPPMGNAATAGLHLRQAGVSPLFDHLLARVAQASAEHFTEKSRVFSRSSEVLQLQDRIERWRVERDGLHEALEMFDRQREELEELEAELPELVRETSEAQEEWNRTQDGEVELERARGELNVLRERVTLLRRESEALERTVAERVRLEKNREQCVATFARANERRALSVSAAALTETSWQTARTHVASLEEEDRHVDERLKTMRSRLRFLEERAKVAELEEHLSEVRGLDGELAIALEETVPVPPAATLTEARGLERGLVALRARTQQLSMLVAVEGRGLMVLGDGKAFETPEGTALEVVEVVAQDGSRVTIRGAQGQEALELQNELVETAERLRLLLAAHDAESLEALAAARENGLRGVANMELVRARRRALDPRETPVLEARLRSLRHDLTALGSEDDVGPPPEPHLAASCRELELRHQEAGEALRKARARREDLQTRWDGERRKAHESELETAQSLEAQRRLGLELEAHQDAHGSRSRVQKRHRTFVRDLARAEGEHQVVSDSVRVLAGEAETRRETARRRLHTLRDRLAAHQARRDHLRELLASEATRGTWSALADVERHLEVETERCERLRRRAEGTRYLQGVLEEVRSEVISEVVAPVELELERMLSFVTRGRYGRAALSPLLEVTGLGSHEADGAAALGDGSWGLVELVNTLLRICVAHHVASETGEPQVVVLDDPCIHVSRDRTARLVELLNRSLAEGWLQCVILTHRGTEFAGLNGDTLEVPGDMGRFLPATCEMA